LTIRTLVIRGLDPAVHTDETIRCFHDMETQSSFSPRADFQERYPRITIQTITWAKDTRLLRCLLFLLPALAPDGS